jgi:hypothetical protein
MIKAKVAAAFLLPLMYLIDRSIDAAASVIKAHRGGAAPRSMSIPVTRPAAKYKNGWRPGESDVEGRSVCARSLNRLTLSG